MSSKCFINCPHTMHLYTRHVLKNIVSTVICNAMYYNSYVKVTPLKNLKTLYIVYCVVNDVLMYYTI